MPDLSLIEFIVYGFVAYSSLLMLIISTIKEVPTGKSLSIARAIWLIPGIIAAAVLAFSGQGIITEDVLTKNLNTTEVWRETREFVLQNTAWATFHLLIVLVLIAYVISQLLILFVKHDEQARPET